MKYSKEKSCPYNGNYQRGILKKEAANQREQQHNENKSAVCWCAYSKISQ
jgi:hypothetical protein